VLDRAASAGHEAAHDEHGPLLRDPAGNGLVLALA
jgi:hypothetical protein